MTTSIYFIQAEHGGPVKIGIATDVAKRLASLQIGHAQRLVIRHAQPGDHDDERALHRHFGPARIRGEWFECTFGMVQDYGCRHDALSEQIRLIEALTIQAYHHGHIEGWVKATAAAELDPLHHPDPLLDEIRGELERRLRERGIDDPPWIATLLIEQGRRELEHDEQHLHLAVL